MPEDAKFYRIGFYSYLSFDFLPDHLQAYYLEDFYDLVQNYPTIKIKDNYFNNLFTKDINLNESKFLLTEYIVGKSSLSSNNSKKIANNTFHMDFSINSNSKSYIGNIIKVKFKVGDKLKIKCNNLQNFKVNLLNSNESNIIHNGNNLGAYESIGSECIIAITETLYNKLINNFIIVALIFEQTNGETVHYDYDITYEIENNFLTLEEYIKYVNSEISEIHNIINKEKIYNVLVLGDSITALNTSERGWLKYFNEIIKINIIANTAVNGAVIKDKSDTVYDGNPSSSNVSGNVLGNQIQKILNNNYEKPDFIMIAIGTNGGIYTTEKEILNSYYDTENNLINLENVNRTTTAGAFRYAIENLRKKYPSTPIFWCSPIQAYQKTRNIQNIIEWNKNLHLLCEYASIIAIDTNLCGICGVFEKSGENGQYLIDGLHPNADGAKLIGYYNASCVKKYIDKIEKLKTINSGEN